jgi:Ca2+-transporting ATPase
MTCAVEIAMQVTIVFIQDGTAFQVMYIGGHEWGISLMLGFMSIPLGALICLLRNQPCERLFILMCLLPKPQAFTPILSHSHLSHHTP